VRGSSLGWSASTCGKFLGQSQCVPVVAAVTARCASSRPRGFLWRVSMGRVPHVRSLMCWHGQQQAATVPIASFGVEYLLTEQLWLFSTRCGMHLPPPPPVPCRSRQQSSGVLVSAAANVQLQSLLCCQSMTNTCNTPSSGETAGWGALGLLSGLPRYCSGVQISCSAV
jgi:hypothetical protein